MTKLREIIAGIVAVEEDIELPSAVVTELGLTRYTAVSRVYEVAPSAGKALADLPCFLNYPMEPREPDARMGNFVESFYTFRSDFYGPPDPDLGPTIVEAYMDATRAALLAQQPSSQRFGGKVDLIDFRLNGPLTLTWAGRSFPGFELDIDVTFFETVVPV